LVIKLTHFQSNIVLNSACLFAACINLRSRSIISSLDFQELSKRLGQPCATREEVSSSLIYDERFRRKRSAPHTAEGAGGKFDQLRVSYVEERCVISKCGEVRASRHLFRVLLFFDMK